MPWINEEIKEPMQRIEMDTTWKKTLRQKTPISEQGDMSIRLSLKTKRVWQRRKMPCLRNKFLRKEWFSQILSLPLPNVRYSLFEFLAALR